MANETYYSLLGISETATTAQIKTAYLALIREVHPDRIANAPAYWQRQAEEKSKEINEAYAVLFNDEKRRLYDAELASRQGDRATTRERAAEPCDPPPTSSTQQHQTASSAPPNNDTRDDGIGLLICWIALLAAALVVLAAAGVNTSQQGSGNTAVSQPSKEPPTEQPPTNSWRYTKSTDEMTGVVSQTACLFSEKKFGGDESELCSYKGGYYPAVFKLGRSFSLSTYARLGDLAPLGPSDSTGLMERGHCNMHMRVDDKPGFQVCWNQYTRDSEVNLYNSPYKNGRGIHIMTMLKGAKIIKIELDYSGETETQIFTFKPDKPLDTKW